MKLYISLYHELDIDRKMYYNYVVFKTPKCYL